MSKENGMELECQSGRSLPEDIEIEILSNLPVKSLMRFKCVSRKWCSLITADSRFITTHLRRQYHHSNLFSQLSLLLVEEINPNTELHISSRILLLRDESEIVDIDITYMRADQSKAFIVHDMNVCCNGLVCLMLPLHWLNNPPEIILWNPATREFRYLPKRMSYAPQDPNHKFIDGDSSINSGFDPRNKDYKVVTITTFYSAGQRKVVVHVFSLKSNCWREVKPYPRLTACLSSANVELNGVLYWSVFEINGILSFDLSDEEFREVDIPRSLKSGAYLIRELVKWERKSLAVIVVKSCLKELECWLMENDMSFGSKPTWTKQWKVSAPFLDTWFWLGVWKDRILMVRRDRGRDHDDGDLLSYDLSDGEKRLIPLIGKEANHSWHLKRAFDYVESLVSVYPER